VKMRLAFIIKPSTTSGLTVSRAAIVLLGTYLLYRSFQIISGLDGVLRDAMLTANHNSELLIVPSNSQKMEGSRRKQLQHEQQRHHEQQRIENDGLKSHKTVVKEDVYPTRQSKYKNPRLASKTEAAERIKGFPSSLSPPLSSGSESFSSESFTSSHATNSKNDTSTLIVQNSTTTNATQYFILHIGPPKTATTSIQCGLNKFSRALARKDNYYFLGQSCRLGTVVTMANGEESILAFDMLKELNTLNTTYLRALKVRVQAHYTLGHHLILSSEHFISKLHDKNRIWGYLKRLTAGFKVKIVIAYRHYFQWIASMYYQQHYRNEYMTWPHSGGSVHPSFQSYLTTHLDNWESSNRTNTGSRRSTHHSLWALLLWSKHFDDVHIFDLHQEGDTFTNFVCQTLPSATSFCNALKHLLDGGIVDGELVVKRVSTDYHAERVVEEAYLKGLIRRDVTKNNTVHVAREAIVKHSVHKNPDYLDCIPQSLEDRLKNASLTFMELLYRADGRQLSDVRWDEAVNEHNTMFDKTKAQGKYCDIHPTNFLQNTTLLEDAIHPMHRAIDGEISHVDVDVVVNTRTDSTVDDETHQQQEYRQQPQ
jgi:hypothetical protein